MVKLRNKDSKAVLITGGAQRIGKSIALVLAHRGFDVALHYNRSQAEAIKVAQEIRQKGVRCELFACDLQKKAQALLLLGKAYKKFPHLNLLINNASIFQPSKLGYQGLELLDSHWAINFKAPYILTGEFVRLCRKGQIINILDTKIVKNKTEYLGYLLSKKALGELTRISAVSLAPHIRVNGISPGLILPPPHRGKEYLEKRAKNIPLLKAGDVKHITQSVEFLLDNEYVTGQTIFADGGEHLI